MRVSTVLVLSLFVTSAGATDPAVPLSELLQRPMSWDKYGAYALNAERPFSASSRKILANLDQAELGRAESLARYRLKVDKDDLVPAWILSQALRVRKLAWAEYRRNVDRIVDSPGSLPVLLYRFQVCRLAMNEMPMSQRNTGNPVFKRLEGQLLRLRDRLTPFAKTSLGVAISITQVSPYWAVQNRSIFEAYRDAHPKGIDIRPLLCQAYNSGVGYGPVRLQDGRTVKMTFPDEVQPERALEIAQAMLASDPKSPLGHFYSGVSQFRLGRVDSALREMRQALETKRLPSFYEKAATAFVSSPSLAVLRQEIPF